MQATSYVYYQGNSVKVNRGDAFAIVSTGDRWVSSADVELGQIKYGGFGLFTPASFVKPGMHLEFYRESGVLSDINVGAYTQVLVNTINLGLLTPDLKKC